MPDTKLSPALAATEWTRKAGAVDAKGSIANQLKTLAKQHGDVKFALLELNGLEKVADMDQRQADLEGPFAKAVKLVLDTAKDIVTELKKREADFKKDANALKASAAVQKELAELQRVLGGAGATALAELKTLKAKAESRDKNAKDKDGEDDEAEALANDRDEKKFRAKMKSQTLSWLKKVKGEDAPPGKFVIANLAKVWGCYFGKNNGETEKKLALRLAGLEGGAKYFKGTFTWDLKTKSWVLEGPSIPTGKPAATALSRSLKELIGFAPKLRLQRPGEIGEESDDAEADPDEVEALAKAAGIESGVDPVKAVTARLAAMMPAIKTALGAGGKVADQLKVATAKAGEYAQKGDAKSANALLDQVEKLLSGLKTGDTAAATEGGDGKLSLVKLGKARLNWISVRQQAVSGIEALAKRLEQDYRDEVEQRAQVQAATARLRGLAAQLKEDLETQLDAALTESDPATRATLVRGAKAQLTALLKLIVQDPLMKELDGNEVMPDLQIVKPMQERLREIAEALG